MKVPKWETVLRAMRKGAEVSIDGLTYALDVDDHLCIKMSNGREDIWFKTDMPFNFFVNECEKLSEEDMVSLIFTSVFVGENE